MLPLVIVGCESTPRVSRGTVEPILYARPVAKTHRNPTPSRSPTRPVAVTPVVRPAATVGAVAKPVRRLVPGFPRAKSLRILRSAKVYREPNTRSERRGYVVGGTRVMPLQLIKGDGCRHQWIELRASSWICARARPSDRQPTSKLLGTRRSFGSFGRVRKSGVIYSSRLAVAANTGRPANGDTVRLRSLITLNGTRYWITRAGSYVAAKHVTYIGGGSRFGGSPWGTDNAELPRAFVLARKRKGRVSVRIKPHRRARVARRLAHRSLVVVHETSANGRWLRIGDDAWVPARRARIARIVEPPSARAANERWVDVDVSQQVLVAYEGKTPVYVTLVSSGKWKRSHRTPAGVFRVKRKVAQTTMRSRPGADDVYSVAGVPWVLYFHGNYAIHGAYWHNGFGYRRSHGCINLSPRDARYVFGFLGPEELPGWWTLRGSVEFPGSIVQIRTRRYPRPRFRGYARTIKRRAGTVAAR